MRRTSGSRRRPARPALCCSARRAAIALIGGIALVTVATACSDGEDLEAAAAPTDASQETYVAVGGSETVGVGTDRPVIDAWPQVFYRNALDRNTVFVNLGAEGSTVAQALEEQVPLALELRSTLVTIWLNLNDLAAGVPVATYEQQLGELVHALRQDGQARVLLGNLLPVERLPIYPALAGAGLPPEGEIEGLVAAYNQATERVAETEGAELVDVHAAAVEAAADGTLTSLFSEEWLHPNARGHAFIADVFAAAL